MTEIDNLTVLMRLLRHTARIWSSIFYPAPRARPARPTIPAPGASSQTSSSREHKVFIYFIISPSACDEIVYVKILFIVKRERTDTLNTCIDKTV